MSARPTIIRSASSRRPRAAAAGVALAVLLLATPGCGDRAQTPPAALDEAACAALADFVRGETAITEATWTEAGASQASGQPLPAYCKVRGVIGARVSERGVALGIGFELRLPAPWSGRFYFQGGFGTDGVIAPALGAFPGGSALGSGFAVVSTDAGHSGGGPEFGLDPQARVDFGYAAVERVTVEAKDLMRRVYGRQPDRSYFVGCSNGGRQAFVAAQRFPDFFDGIVAGAPGFNLPKAAIGQAWNTQAVAAIATERDAAGHPYLPTTFSDADLALLSRGILAACDTNDGLADGIVDDLPACAFDPAALRCPGAKDASCLGDGQIAALAKIFGGARDSRGEALYSDFPFDAGVGDPSPIGALRAWTLGSPLVPVNSALNVTLGAGALAFIFTTPPVAATDPMAFVLGFDFDRDTPAIFATTGPYTESAYDFMTAASTDLAAFEARGGKLLVYHGASDGVFSVNDTIRWYQEVERANDGHAAAFARLFVVPGMGHCAGGPATDQFAAFPAIVDWVERGIAPDQLLATASGGSGFPGRTRPLCPYPLQTRYSGTGSTARAESFACR